MTIGLQALLVGILWALRAGQRARG